MNNEKEEKKVATKKEKINSEEHLKLNENNKKEEKVNASTKDEIIPNAKIEEKVFTKETNYNNQANSNFYKEPKKHRDGFGIFMIIVFAFIVGGVGTLSLLKFTPILDEIVGSTSSTTTIKTNGTAVYEKSSLATSISKAYDAVVMVKTYQSEQLTSTGTGFVYKQDDKYGYVLTNQHVVSGGDKIILIMSDDQEAAATVLGGDSYLDLAVMRIDKKYVKQVVTIGSSEKMNLGDSIFTIGSPLGEDYRNSVTSGILSGKDRMVSVRLSNTSSSDWIMRVLQIDASINPGNSGGPLLNVNGEVIGICSMKLVDNEIEGMGFAIPIEYAMNHIESLEKGNKIEWPLLGISMANTTDTAKLAMNGITIDPSITSGVVVVNVVDGTGAASSDLKSGDVITKLAGNDVKNYAYLRYELYQHQAGETIDVTYIRNGKEYTTKVKLGKSSN